MLGEHGEINSIVHEDLYLIRQYPCDRFDYVIDLGANVGSFAVTASILHPNAEVFAFEPSPETFKKLEENTRHFPKISVYQRGLGNGEVVRFANEGHSHGHSIDPEGDIEIQTMLLSEIIAELGIDLNKRILFKCDCEGGEKYILTPEETEIVQEFDHIAIEIHFRNSKGICMVPDCLEFDDYKIWAENNFDGRSVVYHKSSRHIGYGHYIISDRSIRKLT